MSDMRTCTILKQFTKKVELKDNETNEIVNSEPELKKLPPTSVWQKFYSA
jgi:hypothetical protein